VAEWIGLAGVLAGALIAFSGQYILRRTEQQERDHTLLLEQFALIIALSEDQRNRVWEERNQVASDVVKAWDLGAYRLAEARLRILSPEQAVLTALKALDRAGTQLGKTWRLASGDEAAVDAAWTAHRKAIDRFVAVSSQVIRHRIALSLRHPELDEASAAD
jgi:hypothetical protein